MAAKLEKTKTPGVFKRGDRYTVVYYDAEGKQRRESAHTYDEARKLKSARTTQVATGEFHADAKVRLHDYGREWVKRYHGKGRRGFRENTRDEYTRVLEQYVFRYFHGRTQLAAIQPKHVAAFVGWLCDAEAQGKRAAEQRREAMAAKLGVPVGHVKPSDVGDAEPVALSDSTIKNIMAPLKAMLSTAVREGLIRSNPSRDIDLPHRPSVEDDEDEDVRSMTEEQLATVLALVPAEHRVFFRLLGDTGLRISEAIALQGKHLRLDGAKPVVQVRRGYVKGRMGPPKSKHARREVPLGRGLVDALRQHVRDKRVAEDGLVFTTTTGTILSPGNLRRRVLKPAAEEACVSWIGFHAFRHTRASLLFADGRNAKQVQHWLGHHSAAFTLATYVHLLDGDVGGPMETAPAQGDNTVTIPAPDGRVSPSQDEVAEAPQTLAKAA